MMSQFLLLYKCSPLKLQTWMSARSRAMTVHCTRTPDAATFLEALSVIANQNFTRQGMAQEVASKVGSSLLFEYQRRK